MFMNSKTSMLAFLWRAGEIASAVVDAARSTRTRAIFDISRVPRDAGLDSVGMALVQADAGPDAVDLKVASEALKGTLLEELHKETGINRVWVEFHPVLPEADLEWYLQRIVELSPTVQCIPITGDVEIINRILRHYSGIGAIALKGCEASGFVGRETLFTLYPAVGSLASELGRSLDRYVWGGVATPEAAAGFLSIGAAGIVFESLHWLTDLAMIGEQQRKKISKVRPGHTDLTGLALNVPCRLFNKGNSRAVKDLRKFAGSLCGAEIRDDHRRFFANRIEKEAVLPHEARFDADELVPLGIEAAFAESFTRRFGSSTEEAIDRFASEIEALCAEAGKKEKAYLGSPTARELGVRYPFVQGAMSWITDVPEFALKVADAGGLPTIALGMMDKRALEEKLGKLGSIMGNRPYAVNVITLPENPYRDEQLAWIRSTKPRFTVIAAGEPSHAKELLDAGLEVIYIAPNEEMLQLACEAGLRYLVCEGNEAGGHVGEHSTLTLAQIILDRKQRDPDLLAGKRIILAGGFYDRETAFMGGMLGADALQMGTAYLATKEIVETGALTAFYQRMVVNAAPGDTVLTGEATGLRIRSLRTSTIEQVCSLEREFGAGSEDEASFRHKIEMLTAGSLLIAARGVDKPGGEPLDEQVCIEQGQFMSGACAGVVTEVRTLEELHVELAEANLAPGLPFLGPIREGSQLGVSEAPGEADASRQAARARPAHREEQKERVAITGMSIVNALGNSVEEVWAASAGLRTGIIEVPLSKWDHAFFYDPRPRVPDKTYCKVGAFQSIEVSRKELGIAPQDFRTMTDSTRVTLWLAHKAILDSGILDSDIPRERIAVLISQNAGESAATLRDVILRGTAHHTVLKMGKVVPLTPDAEKAVEEELKTGLLQIDDTTLLGRLNCTAGGFICNKYGFMGPSFSVSAACASALVALYSAYQMIRNGIIDAAVIGGAEEPLTAMHFLEFAAIGALAGLSGVQRPAGEVSRPFDADRDGMVLGEGGGMIVIERESVARRRGARVHAYVTSMGGSNNHLGMVESSRVTQEIAIRASFKDASYGPDKVDLVECHATSTMQGDVEEVHALSNVFGSNSRTFLTSFKSQIGHTLGAAGINSLIRGVMAMNAGIFPPTLNYRTPDPEIELEKLGFWVPLEPVDWPRGNGESRRMEVNAFGFGGSNYVVQVEEALEDDAGVLVSLPEPGPEKKEEVPGVPSPDGISFFRTEIGGRAYRLAVVAESEQEARSLIEKAEPIQGPIAPKRLRALTRQGLYVGAVEEPPPPLAFVFPGQGSHYAGMSHELYQTFPVIREWMDRASRVAEFDILHLLFHDREEDLQKTRWQQPALFTMEYAMVQYLVSLGIRPTALAGHSLGELTALCLSGVYSFEDGFRLVNMRAICMDKACTMNVDGGVMMAVDAPLDYLEEKLSATQGIYVTNINSPHQVVLGGGTDLVAAFGEELKKEGFRRTLLRVSMAFHSPIMRCIHDELQAFVDTLEFHSPKIPVISNTTRQPFPSEPSEIKKIVMAHLESPVHWMDNVRTLWNDFGVRLFVEVGPREILSNLTVDCIEDAECIQTCLPSAESLIYRTALAQLYAKGHLKVGSTGSVTFPGQDKPASRAISPVPAPAQKSVPAPRPESTLERIIQREINAFVLDSFGRFLRPGLLAAIRRDYDPRFNEEDLTRALGQMLPGAGIPAAPLATHAPPVPAPVESAPIVPGPQPAAVVEAPGDQDVAETVIRIIMDATGYERDEISAEMDLREDLAIRSSRLPVIMDSLEGRFGIKIEIEQFMNVRTIQDIADKIGEIVAKEKGVAVARVPRSVSEGPAAPVVEPEAAPEGPKQGLKRVIFFEAPLEKGQFQPIELDTMESVAILSAVTGNQMTKEVGDVLRRDYGVHTVPLAFMGDASDTTEDGFNLGTQQGATLGSRRIEEMQSLAGMVFVLDDFVEKHLTDLGDIPKVLRGFFVLLKPLLESPVRKFALLIHRSPQPKGPAWILAEGLLGLFLSLAHEFPSVQFRSIRLDESTPVRVAIRESLDRNRHPVETVYRDGEAFTLEGRVGSTVFRDGDQNMFNPGDVVVLSGGGQGITYHLARSLVPFGCRLVFLGRTGIDPDIDFRQLISEGASEKQVREAVKAAKPDLTGDQLAEAISQTSRAVEVIGNVEALRDVGVDTTYFSCDVADGDRTRYVLQEIIKRFGRIDGIIHGAGIVRDGLARDMTADDFSAVVDIKYRGALNLFTAAKNSGLKFFVCLSSVAATLGNVGQSNYSTANRAMSALMTHLWADQSGRFKALMLSPIEGAGMAENPEIRAMMKRKKASYVHVEELLALFQEEMLMAPSRDEWVQFMRTLPDHTTVRVDQTEPPVAEDEIRVEMVAFKREDIPMIDSVVHVDIPRGELNATRVFSREKDLWIADHKPFKSLKHPLVSAIMVVETFVEACRILYPYLQVRGIRDVQFLDIIECPPGVDRSSLIACKRKEDAGPNLLCEVSLSTREISPSGQQLDRRYTNYKGLVILGSRPQASGEGFPGFPVTMEELESRPLGNEEVLEKYAKRSGLQGRYRVIHEIDGASPTGVHGRFIYRHTDDFAAPMKGRYQFAPYLLEALLHLAPFYVMIQDEKEEKSTIPYRIGEVRYFGEPRDGETVTIEGRLKHRDQEGIMWDSRAIDEQGRTLMYARDILFRWFSE